MMGEYVVLSGSQLIVGQCTRVLMVSVVNCMYLLLGLLHPLSGLCVL